MKAVICSAYGPPGVLRLAEVDTPAPSENEILIRIEATSVTAGDVRIRAFNVPFWEWLPARLFLGLLGPRRKILGMELAGEVEAVGGKVTRFRPGDQVFAFTGFGFGANAEYICIPENGEAPMEGLVARKPVNMTYQQAATVPLGGLAALNLLKKAGMAKGKRTLVYGASGSVGSFAVQIARYHGARVTAVCGPANLDLVKSLGAEAAIDYTKQDFAAGGERYDIVFDAVDKAGKSRCKSALAKDGVYVNVGTHRIDKAEDLDYLRELVEKGALKTVIDRSYPLERIAEAHAYVERGHKKGNVAIIAGRAAA